MNKVRLRLYLGDTLNMQNHNGFVRETKVCNSVDVTSSVSRKTVYTSPLHYHATITQL